MRGEPMPVEGKCNARLHVFDNYGDNHTTMRCELVPPHDGPHQEVWVSQGSGRVTVTWEREDPQIEIDKLQQRIERTVERRYPDVLIDFEFIEDQNVSATKLYRGKRAVFFRVDSLAEVWVSVGHMAAGENQPKEAAIATLISGLADP